MYNSLLLVFVHVTVSSGAKNPKPPGSIIWVSQPVVPSMTPASSNQPTAQISTPASSSQPTATPLTPVSTNQPQAQTSTPASSSQPTATPLTPVSTNQPMILPLSPVFPVSSNLSLLELTNAESPSAAQSWLSPPTQHSTPWPECEDKSMEDSEAGESYSLLVSIT